MQTWWFNNPPPGCHWPSPYSQSLWLWWSELRGHTSRSVGRTLLGESWGHAHLSIRTRFVRAPSDHFDWVAGPDHPTLDHAGHLAAAAHHRLQTVTVDLQHLPARRPVTGDLQFRLCAHSQP